MKQKIVFRADGGSIIGMGHFVRTLALADILKKDFYCVYATQSPNENQISQIGKICKDLVVLPDDESHFDIFINYLKGDEIVVLDNYYFTMIYQNAIKQKGCKLVCIDDIGNRSFVCDAIINHGEGLNEKDYSCQLDTKLFLGLKYALLRMPFLLASANKRRIEEINTYFVCFGGSDNENFTQNTVEQLTYVSNVKKINIVVGSGYLYTDALNLFCRAISFCEINIYQNVNAKEMVNIMLDSHLAIVPSSSVLYEVLAVKMPIITGYTVDNQRAIYNSLTQKEVVLGIGTFPITNISEKIDTVINNKNRILDNQTQIFDGRSAERLLNIFNDLNKETTMF